MSLEQFLSEETRKTSPITVSVSNVVSGVIWNRFSAKQLTLLIRLIQKSKYRTERKELLIDELSYSKENEDETGLYPREWGYLVEEISKKLAAKGTRNRSELEDILAAIPYKKTI